MMNFHDFSFKPELLRAIAESGFEHTAEVQQECLHQALLGRDILFTPTIVYRADYVKSGRPTDWALVVKLQSDYNLYLLVFYDFSTCLNANL